MIRKIGKWLGRLLLLALALLAVIWIITPREPVDREIAFDPGVLGDDLDAYLANAEAQFDDITPGVEKQIIWAGEPGAQTDLAVIYLHGYSATAQEIRPVPDRVAQALGANLYFTRLRGHGRSGDAMAEARAGDWLEDTAEALEIGRRLGREVIIISTSTGGTLAAIAATDPQMINGVKGITFISPNFGIQNPASVVLNWPFVRLWVPFTVGAERSFEPINAGQAKYWTTRYPTVAVVPMAALVNYAYALDYDRVNVPALFMFSEDDAVVSPKATRNVAERWGWEVRIETRQMGLGDDPFNHVIAGDILSPNQNDSTVQLIIDWAKGLE